jgi:NAD(P)-dependent dehydrogenase (short-subunit alcohol dehydrogenase family)
VKDLKGKTAFVTGAASGIGLGMARTFAREGMNVVLADIQENALEGARKSVEGLGAKAISTLIDVADIASVQQAAAKAEAAFGNIHVVCNNAGVGFSGTDVDQVKREEWDWLIAVNLYGVINGVTTFLPLIRKHGQGGHIVNTASIGGLQTRKGFKSGAYAVTKYGVVAFSEAMENELDPASGIGVSVLCPAAVNTKIYDTARLRQERFGGAYERPQHAALKDILEKDGMNPDQVGQRVVEAIRDNEFFIFTHTGPRDWLEERHQKMMKAMDSAARFEAKVGAVGPYHGKKS